MNSAAQISEWVGRQQELQQLHETIKRRQCLLIWGEPDSGKTALVKRVIHQLPRRTQQACIWVNGGATVRELLQGLVRWLWEHEDPLVKESWRASQASHYTVSGWLRGKSAGRLRLLLCAAVRARPCWIFLDQLPPCTHPVARFLKDLIWRWETPVYLLARGWSPAELGDAWSLYWTDKLRLHLGPLATADATALLGDCIVRFGLHRCDLQDFEHEVLQLSGRLPGAIVKMCAMAAQPKYQYDGRIKTRLLRVDYLMGREEGILHHGGKATPILRT